MGHPDVNKSLPYEFEALHAANRDGVPVAVLVTKATFSIASDSTPLAEKQQPIHLAGQLYGKPGESSYRYEPEYSYFKPNTDVVLIADAIPAQGMASQTEVDFRVGSLNKRAVVSGDRFWYRGFLGPTLTGPEPFSAMPLIYERAFGGWDRSHPDPERHQPHRVNPVGVGFQRNFADGQDQLPLPNVEDPGNVVSSMTSQASPLGFGFTSPDWQPRAALAGTFDQAWSESRAPQFPVDFDERFFNAASPGLIAAGYLIGNEAVYVRNCSQSPVVQFHLPGVAPPRCRCRIAGQPDADLIGRLDTVVVDLLGNIVTLTWRCHIKLPRGPEQLKEISVDGSR